VDFVSFYVLLKAERILKQEEYLELFKRGFSFYG
jgi:hypothetical protein